MAGGPPSATTVTPAPATRRVVTQTPHRVGGEPFPRRHGASNAAQTLIVDRRSSRRSRAQGRACRQATRARRADASMRRWTPPRSTRPGPARVHLHPTGGAATGRDGRLATAPAAVSAPPTSRRLGGRPGDRRGVAGGAGGAALPGRGTPGSPPPPRAPLDPAWTAVVGPRDRRGSRACRLSHRRALVRRTGGVPHRGGDPARPGVLCLAFPLSAAPGAPAARRARAACRNSRASPLPRARGAGGARPVRYAPPDRPGPHRRPDRGRPLLKSDVRALRAAVGDWLDLILGG